MSGPDESGEQKPGRVKRATEKGTAVYEGGKAWVESQDPASRPGAAIGWYERFKLANGGLFAVLLTAYLFITVLPAAIVMASWVYNDPTRLADHVSHRLGLTGNTKQLMDGVLHGAVGHHLGSTLIAVADVLFFGMGAGRVLQICYARAWKIDLGKARLTDQGRYFSIILIPLALLWLYFVESRALRHSPGWIAWVIAPLWLIVVFAFLVWMPRTLLHNLVSVRDVVPAAVFTLAGMVVLRIISSLLFKHWLVWYSQYYGSLGIVMAIFFWIMLFAAILILAAALAPTLAHRRDLREARARGEVVPAD